MPTYDESRRSKLVVTMITRPLEQTVEVTLLHYQKNDDNRTEIFYLTENGWVFKPEGGVYVPVAQHNMLNTELTVQKAYA